MLARVKGWVLAMLAPPSLRVALLKVSAPGGCRTAPVSPGGWQRSTGPYPRCPANRQRCPEKGKRRQRSSQRPSPSSALCNRVLGSHAGILPLANMALREGTCDNTLQALSLFHTRPSSSYKETVDPKGVFPTCSGPGRFAVFVRPCACSDREFLLRSASAEGRTGQGWGSRPLLMASRRMLPPVRP